MIDRRGTNESAGRTAAQGAPFAGKHRLAERHRPRPHGPGAVLWLLGCFNAIGLGLIGASAPVASAAERFEFRQVHMGVPFTVLLYADDQATANLAADAAFACVARLDGLMSDYKEDSELSRLSAAAPSPGGVAVSDPLWHVLCRAQELAARSDGAFDVTVGPLTRLWRRSRRQKELPPPARLAEARAAVGYRLMELDEARHSVRLLRPNMRLDLGGIAMGYAVDEVLKLLDERGVHSALVDASGDIGVSDPPPGELGWKIALAPMVPGGPPSRSLLLARGAVTTSGDAYQYVEIEGRRYSHIIDPRTGLGLTDRSAVTVVAPDCITADSVTKAVLVLGPAEGLKLIDATPGAAAIVVRAGKAAAADKDSAGNAAADKNSTPRAEIFESRRLSELKFVAQ